MRISIFGKGGSGKTTITAAFTQYLLNKNKNVLAIDADMNVHLGKVFDMDVIPISDYNEEIKNYFEGQRDSYKDKNSFQKYLNKYLNGDFKTPIIGTTPPTRGTKFVKIDKNDQFLNKYATKKDNLSLITVGTYNENEVGSSCYHGKLEILEILYHRLLDTEDDFVISDSTAGIDSVGTSLFFVSDINVFVVEPTKKSINVFKDFENIAKRYGIKTYIIANKIEDDEDILFINSEIESNKIIGFIKASKRMRQFEQGNKEMFNYFIKENESIFDNLYEISSKTKRDWSKYYDLLLEIYKANAKDWYNNYYNDKLEKYIDEGFRYEDKL